MRKLFKFSTLSCLHKYEVWTMRTRWLPLVFVVVMPTLAAAVAAQQPLPSQQSPQQIVEQQQREQQALEEDALDQNPETATDIPRSTHATVEAPPELGGLAAREPWHFIGRKLVLSDGVQTKTVGPVFAVRRRLEDQLIYLIVDASDFFNSPTQYAVAVRNLDRMDGNTLITPAAPGMHLLGMQYYAQDYEDIEPEPAPVTGDD